MVFIQEHHLHLLLIHVVLQFPLYIHKNKRIKQSKPNNNM